MANDRPSPRRTSWFILGIVAALTVQAGIGVVTLRGVSSLIDDEKQVALTHEISAGVARLLSSVTDGETGVRGFVITGQEAFLGPYHSAETASASEFANIRRLTAGNVTIQRHLNDLDPLVQSRLAELKAVIRLRRGPDGEAAGALRVRAGMGKALQDSIRAVVREIETEKAQLLKASRAQSARTGRVVSMVTIAGGVASMTLLSVASTIILRENRRRVLAEEGLRTLNRELVAATERAGAADRLKSAFLAIMSHELRTPLNSIIGFTGILIQRLAGPLNPEQEKQLGMVRGSARHLLALINDVLDLSKIEAGQMEIARQPFDPGASITKVVAMVAPLAQAKGLAVSVEIESDLGTSLGDARRFEQVLLNLLSNAIKFTSHGSVTLTAARSGRSQPPALRLAIADTGCGIKSEDLEALFQPFHQIDTRISRSQEGTGLGLAISQRLVGLMGGRITAESVWEQGSTFVFTIPLEGPPNP